MSTEIEQLEAAIEIATKRLTELKAAEAAQTEAEWPKDGDTYFFVDGDGDVVESQWSSDLFDASRMNIGIVYRTVAEAEHELDRCKVLTELRRLAKASGAFDWAKPTQSKYRLVYDAKYRNWVVECNQIARTQGAIYFATKSAANNAIETIGAERLMLLLED